MTAMRYGLHTLLFLLGVAVLLTSIFMAHGVATGIAVPYPDPTPAQAAYERCHLAISDRMLVSASAAWLATGVTALVCVSSRLLRR